MKAKTIKLTVTQMSILSLALEHLPDRYADFVASAHPELFRELCAAMAAPANVTVEYLADNEGLDPDRLREGRDELRMLAREA
jgi:hypothetical protein